jgi:hypothetical protein
MRSFGFYREFLVDGEKVPHAFPLELVVLVVRGQLHGGDAEPPQRAAASAATAAVRMTTAFSSNMVLEVLPKAWSTAVRNCSDAVRTV